MLRSSFRSIRHTRTHKRYSPTHSPLSPSPLLEEQVSPSRALARKREKERECTPRGCLHERESVSMSVGVWLCWWWCACAGAKKQQRPPCKMRHFCALWRVESRTSSCSPLIWTDLIRCLVELVPAFTVPCWIGLHWIDDWIGLDWIDDWIDDCIGLMIGLD